MKDYNWWTDPKNKDEVQRISWWNHPENKEMFELPISLIETNGTWTASFNDETKEILGDRLNPCAQGDTKEEAIRSMFSLLRFQVEYMDDRMYNYERWVPLRVGPWKSIGGKWFAIFGLHFSFRYSKNMKGGWYIPLTNLNISFYNEWVRYSKYKKNRK